MLKRGGERGGERGVMEEKGEKSAEGKNYKVKVGKKYLLKRGERRQGQRLTREKEVQSRGSKKAFTRMCG